MKAHILIGMAAAAAALLPLAAHAELYKWVAPDGKVTYSDVAPPAAARQVERKAAGAGTGPGPALPYELAQAARSFPVTLFTGPDCPPCEQGRTLLRERGIPYSEKTVANAADTARLREAGGGDQLPLLLVGRERELGFSAAAWSRTLSVAGYPEASQLPPGYRNPPAEAAAPVPATAAKPVRSAAAAPAPAAPVPAEALPSAAGNAPPGFRF